MPSAATAFKWQLVVDPGQSWLVIETKNAQVVNVTCKLCQKWQDKIRHCRNYNDAFIRGVTGPALKKDDITKHLATEQHWDDTRQERGPHSVLDLYQKTPIGMSKARFTSNPCRLIHIKGLICYVCPHCITVKKI